MPLFLLKTGFYCGAPHKTSLRGNTVSAEAKDAIASQDLLAVQSQAMSRTLHYLRIAWSAAWTIFALLVCVFWVRSYWRVEQLLVPLPGTAVIGLASLPGAAAFEAAFSPDSVFAWASYP